MSTKRYQIDHLLHTAATTYVVGIPRFEEPSLPEHYPPDLELEPIHLEVDLYFSIPARSVGGRVTTTVHARRGGPTSLVLDAVDFEDLYLQDVDDRPLTWQYDGKKLRIIWQQPFAADEIRRVEVAYRIAHPASGLYFCAPDDACPDLPWYVASDHETERARFWLPCVDLPNVRTTFDFYLRTDLRFTILANGYLVQETDHGDGTKTAHWRLEQPCPSYLACIAIGDFTMAADGEFRDAEKSVPVAYFGTYERTPDDLIRTFGRTKEMLAWMVHQLDQSYPYPKYYQFALPTIAGAMENISLVSWTDNVVQSPELAPELQWQVDQINVHEMAHSFFGDAIVCRDFSHAWLKESWATYIEYCWQEFAGGPDEAAYVYYLHAKRYFAEVDEEYRRPIITRRFRSSFDLYDAHLYEGGACRLHTLRSELGDETFWGATRDYLRRFHGKVVESDDFRDVLEEHSGRSLGKFFDQWFRTPSFPDLKVTFEYDDRRHTGTFSVQQQQVDPDKGVPAFVLETDLGWTIGGETMRRSIRLTEPRHVFVVPMPQMPDQVRFDPDHCVLHRLDFNPGVQMLRTQLTAAQDVIGRILAANELVKTGVRANIEAVVEAHLQEHHWGVRCEFAAALGKADHAAAISGLTQLITAEREPRVLIALLRAAANYRDSSLAGAIQRRLEAGLRPIATQAAYQALGAQRSQAPWDFLVAAADQPTLDGRAQAGAFRALATTRRPEAVSLLQAKATYGGSPNQARPAAISALAEIGKGQEPAQKSVIREQLADLLRDPWEPAAWAAARGLATLGAPEAIPALECFGRRFSSQEQAEVERLVARLRPEDKLDGSALQKQVDDLRDKLRKLEDHVQTLTAKLDGVAETPHVAPSTSQPIA